MSKFAWIAISVLTLAVIILAVLLFMAPAPVQNGDITPAPTPTPQQPFTSENVNVSSPLPGSTVPKIFTVVGAARGPWFFEASFPVQVRDPHNNLVGQGIAQADGEWMTTEFVAFTAPVTIADYSGPADLVFIKDNPSGLPENDDAVWFPIIVQ